MKKITKFKKDGGQDSVVEDWTKEDLMLKFEHSMKVNKIWATALTLIFLGLYVAILFG